MKPFKTFTFLPLLLSLVSGSLTLAQEEELVFQERFINTTGSNISFADLEWKALTYDPAFADAEKPVDVSTLDDHPSGTLAGVSPNIGVELCFCNDDSGHVFLWTAHSKETW